MIELFKQYQLDLMEMLSAVCLALAFFSMTISSIPKQRKRSLVLMELGSALLLIFDRLAYIYRGDMTTMGYWMVRISNYMVFAMTLFVIGTFNRYLIGLLRMQAGVKEKIKRLEYARYLVYLGQVLVIVSQFTNLYYYFDEYNRYVRGPGYVLCYVIPLIAFVLQLSVIITFYDRLTHFVRFTLILFTIAPLVASVLQLFLYGLSLTNLAIVAMAVLLFVFAIFDMNKTVEDARQREIELLKEEQFKLRKLFEETAEALVSSIDAKDNYTRGHSVRVAEYSRMIAAKAGKSDNECDEIFFKALLHDVGKIGMPDAIINKNGRLTDEEFAEIKKHPSIGKNILSKIEDMPDLVTGANYHHERYDGKGYPEGLKGEEIPEIARIVAVADSYDAMTSNRSYRGYLPQETVRSEYERGSGTQFDPRFAKIMIELIDEDKEYKMKEEPEEAPDVKEGSNPQK